jgi:predicted nucleic acid-binding Zn ribbon protein
MPLYLFECANCKARTEFIFKVADVCRTGETIEGLEHCPACKKSVFLRVMPTKSPNFTLNFRRTPI